MAEVEKQKVSNISVIILFGLLSVICAEVFSGSSPLWMFDLWGLFVVLPLYWGHGLILWNIALRFRKTSLIHLYLLGIIYGLYESWMTKVIWAGYMGQDPQFGQFLGFAIGEFLVIALFWHAIFSFIVPLYTFHILGSNEDGFAITKKRIITVVIVVLIASIFLPTGLSFDFGATLLAVASNGALLLIVLAVTRVRHPEGFNLDSLRLGKMGLGIVGIYIAFLYAFLFIVILPERIAPPFTLLLTVLFYALIIAMFYFSKEKEMSYDESLDRPTFSATHIHAFFISIFLLSMFWIIVSPLAFLLGTFLYLGMIIGGPILFFIALFRVLVKRN